MVSSLNPALAHGSTEGYPLDIMQATKITLTSLDLSRLRSMLDTVTNRESEAIERLEEELLRAQVVEPTQISSDVVTMNSRVEFEALDTNCKREVVLVYPRDADVAANRVSVLAPVGSALLGLRVGQTIEWPVPGNRTKRIRILRVLYQPEAAGDLSL